MITNNMSISTLTCLRCSALRNRLHLINILRVKSLLTFADMCLTCLSSEHHLPIYSMHGDEQRSFCGGNWQEGNVANIF